MHLGLVLHCFDLVLFWGGVVVTLFGLVIAGVDLLLFPDTW